MFSKILVPLDGSERAERALPVAGQLARASHGTVILVRVVNDIADTSALLATAPLPRVDYLDRDEREAHRYLDAIAASEALRGTRIEARVEFGITAEVILDSAAAWKADAIVLCSHGRTGLTRWALGSVAQQVVRRSTAPIVLLRERGGLPLGTRETGGREFRILIPLDGSELAEAALAPAISFGSLLTAPDTFEAHLVRVIPFIRTPEHDGLREQAALEASAYLERVAKQMILYPGGDRVRVTTAIVYDLDAAAALSHVAEKGSSVVGTAVVDGCDMIAMATHGRTGLALLAMGSVTDRTLSATVLPALIVRPQNKQQRGYAANARAGGNRAGEIGRRGSASLGSASVAPERWSKRQAQNRAWGGQFMQLTPHALFCAVHGGHRTSLKRSDASVIPREDEVSVV